MNRNIAMQNALLAVAASVLIAACGGGAETTANPLPPGGGSNNNSPYTGPVARDANVLAFQQEFWANAKTTDRCGSCHNEAVGQQPMFVRNDDVNLAYDAAITVTDMNQPSLSRLVEKVGQGHNCWVADPSVCSTIMTTWIENWLGDTGGGGRQIILTPPTSQDPGTSKNFPADPSAFASLIHGPILEPYCSSCHSSQAPANTQRQPYHGDPNIDVAYDAAKPKINLDTPANSQLVTKLRLENHNCWSGNCAADAQQLEDAITVFANGITATSVDPNLIFSKALKLTDGTIASGGNRYEDAQIALWEFKTGTGLIAYDTSGVDPAIDLNLSQPVTWYGGWGITMNGGVARGTTTASSKVHDVFQESGEFSIEAWVVPANVTQEMARIVSYSAGDQARNFTLQQTLYNYDFQLRTTETSLNGDPALSTPDADEVLQATLQHVVATYDPIEGRRIYVNGDLVSNTDPVPGGTLIDWQDTFALVLGAETSGEGQFAGTIRLAALHRRALTQQQVQQNFDVGVGEKFFLLFDISEILSVTPQTHYILFEVAQYDSYAYLFDRPHFITLDGSTPTGIPIEGVRVAMNGLEAPVGQTYATMVDTLDATQFQELGQPLSQLGAVLPLEKGPDLDEFFLTFDRLGPASYNRPADPTLVLTETDLPPASQIGLRTFDEINATFSSVLGINWTQYTNVDMTYQELRQSLPAVEDINTFLSSHQVAVAQLAIAYCDAFIGTNGSPGPADSDPSFPAGFFSAPASTSFSAANRGGFITPLVDRIMGSGLTSQPAFTDVNAELATFTASGGRPDNLAQRLLDGGSDTRAIAKGVCAATLGNATTLIQ
ncbi:MAG: LamG domain-containing protein [Woeseiaceae bacterium]|nr:LamG domain-containing protein [Woeseiaceae bacterium]NIP21741.1 LamG domain-containing protein [Woeseiaceae bacterium]NIS90826.1 LamG domain-containing protein [Woeseiaceae bacterium]